VVSLGSYPRQGKGKEVAIKLLSHHTVVWEDTWFTVYNFFTPPYGSMERYLVYCVFVMVALCNRADHYIFAL